MSRRGHAVVMRTGSKPTLREAMWRGAAAGAAGTTALHASTNLDIAWRGRAPSRTPEQTVERLAGLTGLDIPGHGETRRHRVEGLGALSGTAAGVAAGMVVGVLAGRMHQPSFAKVFGAAATTALLVGNGPMTVLGITDPRRWTRTDWLSDVVPHLAYALTAASVLSALSTR
jgi:hypothetical protein